ncbi:hypothetical protein [Ramlibacter sp. AN1133]|uniref:hypothetical protein n=1 Tax=Ramlibacter sp. AN1133 TaxID=3133429 RepID=UPI0030C45387
MIRNEIALAAHRQVFPHSTIPATLAEERERQARYYVALNTEMERCRVERVTMRIGAGIGYGVPAAPRSPFAGVARSRCRPRPESTGKEPGSTSKQRPEG